MMAVRISELDETLPRSEIFSWHMSEKDVAFVQITFIENARKKHGYDAKYKLILPSLVDSYGPQSDVTTILESEILIRYTTVKGYNNIK
jgi:hypothetical protein